MNQNSIVAFYSFPCGVFRIQQEGKYITSVSVVGSSHQESSVPTPLTDTLARQLDEYFGGTRENFQVPYQIQGTAFQNRVWNALCTIPYGQTRSYQDIAKFIGNPRACRAVGMANHRNPLMILVPCHRVIGADGSLGGYAGGIKLKEFLLNLEKRA